VLRNFSRLLLGCLLVFPVAAQRGGGMRGGFVSVPGGFGSGLFDTSGYVGVSGIEDGLTNVCGIAPESLLRRYGFDFDEIVLRSPGLAERWLSSHRIPSRSLCPGGEVEGSSLYHVPLGL
jgi:hypothetical protein